MTARGGHGLNNASLPFMGRGRRADNVEGVNPALGVRASTVEQAWILNHLRPSRLFTDARGLTLESV